MEIKATNNFRYRIMKYDTETYLIDILPHWYTIFFGIYGTFFKIPIYSISKKQEEILARNSVFDKLGLATGPIVAIFISSLINHYTRKLEVQFVGTRIEQILFVLICVLIMGIFFMLWRIGRKKSIDKKIGCNRKKHYMNIQYRAFRETKKIYIMSLILEFICQGAFYFITLLMIFYPGLSININFIVSYLICMFLYFFCIAFVPDGLFCNIRLYEEEV